MSKEHDWKLDGDWFTCQSCNSRVSILADYASTKYGCKGSETDLLSALENMLAAQWDGDPRRQESCELCIAARAAIKKARGGL